MVLSASKLQLLRSLDSPPRQAPSSGSVWSLNVGDLVKVRGVSNHADVDERLRAYEGALARVIVPAAHCGAKRGAVAVQPVSAGHCVLEVSHHFLMRMNRVEALHSCLLCRGVHVRLQNNSSTGRVVCVSAAGSALVQLDDKCEGVEVDANQLMPLSGEAASSARQPALQPLLYKYQHQCLSFFCQKQRALGVLPTGAGKTFIGMAWLLRMLHVCHGCIALLVVPSTVQVKWEADLRLGVDPALRKQLHVLTHESLIGVASERFAGGCWDGCWDDKRVCAIFIDEVHLFRNGGTRAAALQQLVAPVAHVVGVTATPLSTSGR